MDRNKLKLLYVLLVFGCVTCVTKRISELKCAETASLVTDPQSHHPYLMEILRIKPDELIWVCAATLISENYVLTSAYCVYFMQFNKSSYKVGKFKFSDEIYSNNLLYGIKRVIFHPSYNPEFRHYHDIGLIELNKVSYLNGESIFRPACLWNGNINESSLSYSIYSNNQMEHDLGNEQVRLTEIEKCTKFRKFLRPVQHMADSILPAHMCLDADDSYNFSNNPVMVQVNSQNYVIGIVSRSFLTTDLVFRENVIWAAKLSNSISWIESTVWPNHTYCGERKVKHIALMSNAQPSYSGEFPWHVAIFRAEDNISNNQKYICGGSIINSRSILTAGHCVQDSRGKVPHNRITIVAGTHSLTKYPIEAQTYFVKEVVMHQNYSRSYLENDIAILKLKESIEFSNYIQPICISNTFNFSEITMGIVAGWGRDENNQPSDVLLQATLPIIDEFQCRASNRGFFSTYMNSNNYCAGYNNGTNVCTGDSGGGMIFEHNSRFYLRGLVSLGVVVPNSNRCDTRQRVLFTNLPKFYDWILKNIQDEE